MKHREWLRESLFNVYLLILCFSASWQSGKSVYGFVVVFIIASAVFKWQPDAQQEEDGM